MSKPFAEATIQRIAFTFERNTCGQFCGHKGATIGMTSLEKVFGTRIGVCRKYLNFSPEAWGSSKAGQEQIQRITRHRESVSDQQRLNDEAGLRPGDSIYHADKRSLDGYELRIKGMTKEQAIASISYKRQSTRFMGTVLWHRSLWSWGWCKDAQVASGSKRRLSLRRIQGSKFILTAPRISTDYCADYCADYGANGHLADRKELTGTTWP